ncbi:MAG: hypothetical protein AAFY56_18680 [Pseudomonadota bacterium]
MREFDAKTVADMFRCECLADVDARIEPASFDHLVVELAQQ